MRVHTACCSQHYHSLLLSLTPAWRAAAGPNLCSDNSTCTAQYQRCSTGIAGGALVPHIFYCTLDLNPSAKPNGAGIWCYESAFSCENGANVRGVRGSLSHACITPGPIASGDERRTRCAPLQGCGTAVPCVQTPGACSTGIGSNSGFVYSCLTDFPVGSLPNGAGRLCYASEGLCNTGPNACNSTANPVTHCIQERNACATGLAGSSGQSMATLHGSTAAAGPLSYEWECPADTPAGSVPSGSGSRCYLTLGACLRGARSRGCLPGLAGAQRPV